MTLQRMLGNLSSRVRQLLRPPPREGTAQPAPPPRTPRPLLLPLPLARMAGVLPTTAAFLAARQRDTLGWGWQSLPALPAWAGGEPSRVAAPARRASWRGVLPAQLARFTPAVRPLSGPAAYRRFAQERLAAYTPSSPAAPPLPEPAPPEASPPDLMPDDESGPPHVPELIRRLMRQGTARGAAPEEGPPPVSVSEPGPAARRPPAAAPPGPLPATPTPVPAFSPAATLSERPRVLPAEPAPASPAEPPPTLPARPRPPTVAVVPPAAPAPGPPPGGPRPLAGVLRSLARAVGLQPRPAPPPPAVQPLPRTEAPRPVAGAARPAARPLARESAPAPPTAPPEFGAPAVPEAVAGRPVGAPVPRAAPPSPGPSEAPSAPPLSAVSAPARPRLEAFPPSPAPPQPLPRLSAVPPAPPAPPTAALPEPVGPVLAAAGEEARHLAPEVRRRLARLDEGTPLPQPTRRFLEGVLRLPLAGVRLHAGPDAAAVTREVGALAATVGRHILLSATRPDESTPQGLALLAHEALHAVQGGRDRPGAPQSRQEEAAARWAEETVRRAARATPPPVRYPPPAMPLPPSIAAEGPVPTVAQAVREGWAAPRPLPAVPAAGPLRRATTVGETATGGEQPAPRGDQAAAPPAQGSAPDLDALTEEVLRRLRYRLELERERRGY